MNTIEIDENTKVLLEPDNFTLMIRVKSGIAPGGKVAKAEYSWRIEGYYATLVSALQSYVTNAPARRKDGEIKDLSDAVRCIQEAEKHIETLIHKNK